MNFSGQNGDNTNEQSLVDGFVTEAIQHHGIPVTYMPRTLVKEDELFGEDVMSAFGGNAFDIEAFLETFEAYGGGGDVLTPFGLTVTD